MVLFAIAQVCDNCQLDFLCVEKKCSIMNYEKCQVRLTWKMVQDYLLTFNKVMQFVSLQYFSQRIEAGSDKMDGNDLIIVQSEKKKKKKGSATKRKSKSATRR